MRVQRCGFGLITILLIAPAALAQCPHGGLVEIVLTGRPGGLISSYPIVPHKKTRFTARAADGCKISVDWTLNPPPSAAAGSIEIDARDRNNVTYYEPTNPIPQAITLKATPRTPGYSEATVNIIVAPDVLISCSRTGGNDCEVQDFDRLAGMTGTLPARPPGMPNATVNENTDRNAVTAINSSKALFSGSLIYAHQSEKCNRARTT